MEASSREKRKVLEIYIILLPKTSTKSLETNLNNQLMVSKYHKLLQKLIPKMSSLKFMFLLRLLVGNYYTVSKSKLCCILIRLYCLTIGSTCSICYFYRYCIENGFRVSLNRPFVFAGVDYALNVVFSLILADKHIFKYWNAMKTTDRVMGFKKVPLMTKFGYISFVTILLVRFLTAIVQGYIRSYDLRFFNTLFILLSTDLNHIVFIITFSILHSRMRLLRLCLEKVQVPVNIVEQNTITVSIYQTKKSLYNYDNLLDNMLITDKQLQYQVNINGC